MTDRPWGMTLSAIALRRHTGQLTVQSDGKRYGIAFHEGAIVAAASPLAADALPRIALTNHYITSTQVADITRRIAASPGRDEVEVLAGAIRCSPDQLGKLRHRLIAQRAARTFSLEQGEFVLDDRITLPVIAGARVDHRHVIYLGVRTNLAEQRLLDDLRQLGSYFMLKPEAIDELPRFGFEESAHPVIEALKLGTGLPELEASHRELDPRFAQAIIYALVSCSSCAILSRTTTQPPQIARAAPPAPQHSQPPPVRGAADAGPERSDRRLPEGRIPLVNTFLRTTKPAAPPTGPTPRDVPATPSTTAPPSSGAQPAFADGTPAPEAAVPMPPYVARSTVPRPEDRATTSPFAPRAIPTSLTAYASAAAQDPGTNTPAATRSRAQLPTPQTPTPAAKPVVTRTRTPTALIQTPAVPSEALPPAAATPPEAPAAPAAPGAARARTPTASPQGSDSPIASPLPSSGKQHAVTFVESQLTRARSPTASGASRPAISRTQTSEAEVIRGFADQHTPSGFIDQHTPGFSEQRTPAEQRTPTDPASPRTSAGAPTPSRVSTDNAIAAADAFKRGEAAMRRDQPGEAILEYKAACDQNPAEVDYAAMLAWAKFCAAGDKPAIGVETRKLLERAVFKSLRPERARFYLGRVERMLGRDKEALRHFQEVLDLKPNHVEAASEIRAIEARLQAASKSGLFGRKR